MESVRAFRVTGVGFPLCSGQPGIGLDAINDGLLIEMCIYRLLKRHCREQPYYLNLMELFLQVLSGAVASVGHAPRNLAGLARERKRGRGAEGVGLAWREGSPVPVCLEEGVVKGCVCVCVL